LLRRVVKQRHERIQLGFDAWIRGHGVDSGEAGVSAGRLAV
jgi:hypothetical protein